MQRLIVERPCVPILVGVLELAVLLLYICVLPVDADAVHLAILIVMAVGMCSMCAVLTSYWVAPASRIMRRRVDLGVALSVGVCIALAAYRDTIGLGIENRRAVQNLSEEILFGSVAFAASWIVCGLTAYYADAFLLRRRTFRAVGHCLNCGYSLRGTAGNRCPECGTVFRESEPDRGVQRLAKSRDAESAEK